MPDDKALLQEYQAGLSITPHNTKQLFVIAMVGLVGSGKSTFAKQLAATTGLYITSNDTIRRFLNAKGFDGAHPVQQTLQYIAESTGKYLYQQQVSHIIDADLLKFHELARQNAAAGGARLYLVKVDCPEEVILERIKQRSMQLAQGSSENESREGIEEYRRRKAIFDASTEPEYDFVVHTDQPLEPQIQALCDALRRDGVL